MRPSFSSSFAPMPWRALAVALALAAGAAPPALAQAAAAGVSFTSLASMRPAGDDVTTPDGTTGWPGARYPTSPPLYAVRPGSTQGYLYGGFLGAGLVGTRTTIYTAVGLYSMFAGVSVYERLAYDDSTGLYGRINGTPVRARDGSLYALMTSQYGEQFAGTDRATVFDSAYSPVVGQGVVVRTDFDGTYPAVVEATRGRLYSPNGALVIDAADNLYGVDKGPQGQGRIFKIALATGALSTVHEFGRGPNGMKQVANDIVFGTDGKLYGVTGYYRGLSGHPGTPSAPDTPTGTLYRIDPADPASFTVLHAFTLAEGEINISDNAASEGFLYYPSGERIVTGVGGDVTLRSIAGGQQTGLSSLVDGGDGYLYGATSVADCYVAVINTSTATTLRRVDRESPLCGYRTWAVSSILSYVLPYPHHDGQRPYGALYRIPKAGGALQMLHTFSETDGATPRGPMALAADGAIYGSTLGGGSHLCKEPVALDDTAVRCGTLYRIKPAAIAVDAQGQVTNGGFEHLRSFSGNDGRVPLGVRAAADGRLYGVTSLGGSYSNSSGAVIPTNYGTVFQLAVEADGAPQANASLVVTPAQIAAGESTTLTWITDNTTSCSAASSGGDWQGSVASYGSVTLTPQPGTYRYTLTCNVAGSATGAQVSATTTLYVSTTATAEDGNSVSFGNGGGGPLSPWLLAPLGALAWHARRQRPRR